MQNNKDTIRILGIDPGFDRLGLAIIEKKKGQKETLIFSECFTTPKTLPFYERLSLVRNRCKEICSMYTPDVFSVETLFFSVNKLTALKVAEARGVIIQSLYETGIPLYEYAPGQVKIAVTGYGNADKKAIFLMIPRLISISPEKTSDDELDAIALSLTCLASEHFGY